MAKQDNQTKDLGSKETGELAKFDYGEMAGSGFENVTTKDLSIPFLTVLQALSPEVQPGEDRVPNAEAGMLFNTVTRELFDPKEGICFQPVCTQHCFMEWRPRNQGGGLVGKHSVDSEVVAKAQAAAKAANAEFGKLKTAAGNDLIETRYILGYILRDPNQEDPGEPIMISFTSTKMKVYKNITTRLYTFAGRPPLFAHRLRITSSMEENPKGKFYNFKIEPFFGSIQESLINPAKESTRKLLTDAFELKQSFEKGETKVNYEKQGGASNSSDSGEEVPF
jgi:hypothetical protein